MNVTRIIWTEKSIEHIARHLVIPAEVEEVCFSSPWILKVKKGKRERRYVILGQTAGGRYLTIFVVYIGHGAVRIVTAREMDKREKKLFKNR